MEKLNSITLESGLKIDFGIPSTQEESEQMFALRHEVYVEEKEYIPKDAVTSNLERDKWDLNGKCIYFIATIEGRIAGTSRIIKSDPLPTECDYYSFTEPEEIALLPRDSRAEIGRIISRPSLATDRRVPRHIIMLGLFYTMAQYGSRHGIEGGYGSIKNSALTKIEKLGIPIQRIKNYSLQYDPTVSTDPLKNFFSDSDKVVLIYFMTGKVLKYLNLLFNSKWLFKKVADNEFIALPKPNLLAKLMVGATLWLHR